MKSKNKLINSINTDLYIFQYMELLGKYEQKIYTEIGITAPQLYVMAALKYLPSPVIAKDVSKWLNRSGNAINATLNTMVKNGLVKRTRNLRDRRNVRLTLTPKSEALFSKATSFIKDVPGEVMSPLSNDELQSMINSTQKLIKHLIDIMNVNASPTQLDSYHRVEAIQQILTQENIDYNITDFYQFLSDPKPAKAMSKRQD